MLAIFLLAGLCASSRFLVCSSPLRKCDIVIQCVGEEPEEEHREAEARLLVQEGNADYLYIPTFLALYRGRGGTGGLTAARFTEIKPGIELPGPRPENEPIMAYFQEARKTCRIPGFYENTHAEIVLAKKAMDACGFRKAIFVSSPYHMRRIKLITDRMFGPEYEITLAPTRFERSNGWWIALWQDLPHVFTELPKMCWFLCYDLRDRWTRVNH